MSRAGTGMALSAVGILLVILIAVAVLGQGYVTAVHQRDRQLVPGCQRGLFERLDSIDSDGRQDRFFRAAAVARRAGGTELDRRIAADYERFADEAQRSADRRRRRLLGARENVLRLADEAGPRPEAIRESLRVCERAYPKPKFVG